jgi:A/G-specific adenine glycosylase
LAVRSALLRWFRRKARSLPWRKNLSPYAIWVSEVMLQQTQVAAVIPYYQRFLRAFPTARRLAQAPLEQVLELWSGLGYYRRARRLHRAAHDVVDRFGGRFPRDYHQACSLPGVGDYTARAILSIAYNLPYYVLDGNVARVVSRLRALRGHIHQSPFRQAVEHALDALLSHRQPGNLNQAIMELGQSICSPRAPQCPVCPLRSWCRAYRLGHQESYPAPRPRRAREQRFLAAAVIRHKQKVAMVRGLDEGLLSDLWNFPAAFGNSRAESLTRLKQKLAARVRGPVCVGRPFAEVKHGITYRSIRVDVYRVEILGKVSRNSLRWFPLSTLPRAAISQLARKIAKQLL